MSTIREVSERFAALDLMREAQIAIGRTGKEMVKLQSRQRTETGNSQRGLPIGPKYSPVYRELKIEAGHGDFVDLNLTGETDRKMFVDVDGDQFTIASDGELFSQLEARYGEEAYGLNAEYIDKYIEQAFWPKLKQQIEKIIGISLK